MDPPPQSTSVSSYNSKVLVGVPVAMIVLTTTIVALRFYVRRVSRINIWWDDWTMLVSQIFCIGGAIALITAATLGGMGEHQKLGPNGELVHYAGLTHYSKSRYAIEVITTLSLGTIKISVLLFYNRIFDVKMFRRIIYWVMALVTTWTLIFTFVTISKCHPVSDLWERFEIEYPDVCIDVKSFYDAIAVSDLILNFIVLFIPYPIIWKLKMPLRKKIEVIDIFLLNAIVIASGVMRLFTLQDVLKHNAKTPLVFLFDTTWWTAGPIFWSWCELPVAIIGACLPTLAPLWRRRAPPGSSRGGASSSAFQVMSRGTDTRRPTDPGFDLETGTKNSGSSLVNVVTSDVSAGRSLPLKAIPRAGIMVETETTFNISEHIRN